MIRIYIFNKYEYGYNAYKRGFDDFYSSRSKSLTNEIRSITYYLKKNGKTLEEIKKYMLIQLKNIYSCIDNPENYIKGRLLIVEREYNYHNESIKFCQKEIDFLNKYNKNEGRIIFYIMCINKMYNREIIDLKNKSIRNEYGDKIDKTTTRNIFHKLTCEKIIIPKMQHFKNGRVEFTINISKSLINLYDNNPVFEFENLGNLPLLFDYVTGRIDDKRTILCAKCGVIVERKGRRQKYCELCSHEIQKELQKESMRKLRSSRN